MSIRCLKYMGSKLAYTEQINKIINQSSNRKTYVEPFMGSCAVFLNLNVEFENYFLFDIDRHIVRIFNSLKNVDTEYLKLVYERVRADFGDIRESKESYYKFRSWVNEFYWNKDTIEEGIYLFFLYNSCINSMARFGKNGFNQGWGNRDYSYPYIYKDIHSLVHAKLQRATIQCANFFDLDLDDEGALYFLDPPYHYKPSYTYTGFSESDFKNYIKKIQSFIGDVVYTDTDHEELNWNKQVIRMMRTISPSKSSEHTLNEVIFFNFETKNKPLF